MVPFLPIHYFKISMFFDDLSTEIQRYFGVFLPFTNMKKIRKSHTTSSQGQNHPGLSLLATSELIHHIKL